jgi:hypothetical protein
MRPGHLEADKETFADLVESVPRTVVDFLKDQDFGSAWRDNQTDPLYTYVAERNAIERKRARLTATVRHSSTRWRLLDSKRGGTSSR